VRPRAGQYGEPPVEPKESVTKAAIIAP